MADANGGADHAEATVEQLAELYDRHDREAGPIQRMANRLIALLGRPSALAGVVGVVFAWMAGNWIARLLGSRALEQFPFPDLSFVATVAGFIIVVLILTTQRHEEQLAEARARLTLQIAVLSEKKIAKVIALLEEQRRDNPLLPERHDAEAAAMSEVTDPQASLARLDRQVEQNGS